MHATTIIIGAGQAGLALSRCLTEAGQRPPPPRARTRRRALAQRAGGLLPPAHAELADPAARLPLPGPGARRVHGQRPGRRLLRRLRRILRAARPDRRDRDRGHAAPRRRLAGRHRPRRVRGGATSSWPPVTWTGRPCPPRPPGCGRGSTSCTAASTATRDSCRRAPRWSWAPAPRASRSPTSSAAPAGRRWSWPPGCTGRCRAGTGATTCTGGWSGSGLLDRTVDTLPDPDQARDTRSSVLEGGTEDLDLRRLHRHGVQLTGRLLLVEGTRVAFGSSLADDLADADANATRLRCLVDDHVRRTGLAVPGKPWERPAVPRWASGVARRPRPAARGHHDRDLGHRLPP